MQTNQTVLTTLLCAFMILGGLRVQAEATPLNLVPLPRQVELREGARELAATTAIVVQDQQLLPLAKVLSHNIFMQTGLRLPTLFNASSGQGIVLGFAPELGEETYTVSIDDSIKILGRDYRSVAWGASTLLQLLSHIDGKISLPRCSIKDSPDYEFRSVMLDLARRWHPIDTVKQTIDLLSLYKINYLHLHLSDTQSCVYTSRVLPKMATRQAYSWDEMLDIVKYADKRGVTIIPEIDVPGHSSSWVRKMPELFGTTNPETGESRPLGIVNMANEKSYEALDQLVGELSEVFASSPYIHMGTDETGAGGLIKLPEYKPYCEKHGLTEAAEGKAHELFLHFIQRMNKIVRKHGKQAIAWNDFGGASTANVTIPNNVTTMYWVGSPNALVNKGYPIINCCRLPLYMVPPQQSAPEDHRIYAWNAHTFANWHSKQPTVLPDSVPIKGAQICFWEQRYNEVLPILRPRVPAFAERLWHENSERTIDDLRKRRDHTDQVVQKVIAPVTFETDGLIDDHSVDFEESLTVRASSSIPGTIRYSLSKEWETFPDEESDAANEPIKLNDTMTVSARLYDESGKPLGGVTQQRFRKMVPAYRYRLLGPTPNQGWPAMPDLDGLEELQTGIMGLMDRDRGAQINRAMFAGLNPHGHVDVRLQNIYNPFTLELTGQIKFPVDGEYTFKLKSRHGLSELHSGDHAIVAAKVPGREYIVKGKVKAGTYPLTIKHFYRITQNELNIWVKKPGDTDFEPLETLVVPLSKWVSKSELKELPDGSRFIDPVKAENLNLATDKPVKATSWQANHVPSNVVDGVADNSSGWHADPYPQWLQVDLGEKFTFKRIQLFTYHDGRRSYQYTIEVSQDGKKWNQVVDMTKNVKPSSKQGDEHNFDTVRARYVKVNMLNNTANPGVHINELMVFEDKSAREEASDSTPLKTTQLTPFKADYRKLAFYPDRWRTAGVDFEMLAWEGHNIVFLTKKGEYDATEITAFVARLDDGWRAYSELIGKQPRKFKTLNSKPVICAIPKGNLSCGYGCGFVGATGIEASAFYRLDLPNFKKHPDSFQHYYFYEMGRNFFVFGNRHSLFTTGYAVFMRYVCMDRLECKDLDAKTRKTIESCEEIYANSDIPFFDAFTNLGSGEKSNRLRRENGGIIQPSDQPVMYATAMLKLRRDYGGDRWVKQFYEAILQCKPAKARDIESAQTQVLNWLVCASIAAEKDLTSIFVDRWRMPFTKKQRQIMKQTDWTTPGLDPKLLVSSLAEVAL